MKKEKRKLYLFQEKYKECPPFFRFSDKNRWFFAFRGEKQKRNDTEVRIKRNIFSREIRAVTKEGCSA